MITSTQELPLRNSTSPPSYRPRRVYTAEGECLGATTSERGERMVELGLWESVGVNFQIKDSTVREIKPVLHKPSFSGFSCTGIHPSDSESDTNPRNAWAFRKTVKNSPVHKWTPQLKGAKR
jgi:hypothetical protein